ncbi:MAG TPA: hypothetical protein VMT20_21730 [Terriglobia bacterium]|nr:hypothetical protein [Terriglobia bacterium]
MTIAPEPIPNIISPRASPLYRSNQRDTTLQYDNGEQYARGVVEETLAKLGRSKSHEVPAAQVYQHSQQLALGVSR